MPELPEVETVARGVAQRITGLSVSAVHLIRKDVIHGLPVPLEDALQRRRIRRVSRRGKQIHIEPGSQYRLVVHLGMTGRLTVVPAGTPVEPHTHLRVAFRNTDIEMRFKDPRRFGGIWLCPARSDQEWKPGRAPAGGSWIGRPLPKVGLEPLDLTPAELARLLSRRRQIKALLLDQKPISGIGNIYCDEILHRARIHPLTCAANLNEQRVRRLHRCIRQVLTAAIAAGGSTINDYRNSGNEIGFFQQRHRVYDRAGKPCRTCREMIRRSVVAGRGTFYCQTCQVQS